MTSKGNFYLYIERAIAKQRTRDFDGALTDLAEAIDRQPKSARAEAVRVNRRGARGDLDQAIQDHEKAGELADFGYEQAGP